MNKELAELLSQLEGFGEENDQVHSERPLRMLNITRDTGEFLSVMVRATNARSILEIGTSNGYSTLWLASAAAAVGGSVTTVEFSSFKVALAQENFCRSGLSDVITLLEEDAAEVLAATGDGDYDLIFLDSERSQYLDWWPQVKRALRPGGLVVVDNATSHAEEMAPFMAIVASDSDFCTCLVPVGNGEFLATRSR